MHGKNPEFSLRIVKEGIEVLLDCEPPIQELDPLVDAIENELKVLGVAQSPDRRQLKEKLRQAADGGEAIKGEVLVSGQPPSPPKDGSLKWTKDFFSSTFAVDEETGTIDYRQRNENRVVEAGQFLACVTPPVAGKPGRDVFGKPVLPKIPKKISIRLGANVRVEEREDTLCYFAAKNGRIRWAAATLAVDEVYTIEGDVCMETGNIDHPGAVVVKGDVLAGFKLRAGGNVDIMGVVEPADIETEGDLTVDGGITGTKEHSIKVAGSLTAKYILDANIEAGENISVENEVIQSHLKTRGAVVMPTGRLVGGEVCALRGVSVGQAGSDNDTPTMIVAAEDYRSRENLRAKHKEIDKIERDLQKMRDTLAPLLARERKLSAKEKEIASKLSADASEMEQVLARTIREVEDIKAESQEREKPRIFIRARLYSDVTLRIKGVTLTTDKLTWGPVTALFENGTVVLKAMGG